MVLAALLALLSACAAPITPESGEGASGEGASGERSSGERSSDGQVATTRAATAAIAGFPAVIERVVDGDTIVVTINKTSETVRLLGIDTPEKPGGPRPAECFGAEASAVAEQLLPVGTEVLLRRDVETRDQYGRLLAYVYRADDELFVNLALVESGSATALFYSPNTAARDQFSSAAASARKAWRGFWSMCGAADIVLAPS